ncbi:hypothetical protein GCM10010840_23220 [Deinococcus aerolatus]|uniref:DUF4395 domain-containing protein n=1 Tax=Deinococcus aerolatus TaxID=522487 RepID=A0ABQ2GC21_9DEIO|nr:DUF4395 domain-containing protein [Deinococcus aerolatus]GGL84682.1 hypothetical protein GCM10010840_23220 [Deinococcus aerolatus]
MITSALARLPSGPAQTDLSALKFNQYTVIGVTTLALVSGLGALTLALGAAILLGALRPDLSPLRAAYRMFGRRLGLRPEVVAEDPRAHHFAQGVGGVFLLASALSGLAGAPLLSLGLGLAVIALAGLNLSQKICVGCLMYFQYRRLRYAVLSR